MLAIIVVVLGALAVVAIAFSSYLSMVNSSSQVTKALEERRLINDWVLSIQQSMRPLGLDRTLLVPNGRVVGSNDYLSPPESINLPSKNAWDKDIIYCPFSLNVGSGSTSIPSGDGESYSATMTLGSDGIEYVYSVENGANTTNTELMAAIISPLPAETSPSCSDIVYDSQTGKYVTANYDGIVYPVVYNSMIVSNQAKSVTLNSGTSESLSDLVSDWDSILPDVLNINIDNQSADFNTSDLRFINSEQSKSKSIVLHGKSVNGSILNGSSSSVVLFENVTVNLKDITLGDSLAVSFINSDVTLDNVKLNNVSFEGSRVFVKNSITISGGSAGVRVQDSEISGSSATIKVEKSANVGISLANSSMSSENILLENLSSGGVGVIVGNSSSFLVGQSMLSSGTYLDNVLGVASGGSLNLSSINILISNSVDTFLFNQGDVYLDNLLIDFNSSVIRGIILGLNSDTVLNQVQVGTASSRPSVGIEDLGGAKFIGGFNTIVYGQSNCWIGDIFQNVAPAHSGSTSEALTTSTKSSNRSVWQCDI